MNDNEKMARVEAKLKALASRSISFGKIEPKQFRNKRTGEIKTQIPLFEIGDYEEVDRKPIPKKPSANAPFSAHLQYSIDKLNGGYA